MTITKKKNQLSKESDKIYAINSTPTIIINGRKFSGGLSVEQLRALHQGVIDTVQAEHPHVPAQSDIGNAIIMLLRELSTVLGWQRSRFGRSHLSHGALKFCRDLRQGRGVLLLAFSDFIELVFGLLIVFELIV